MSEETMVCKKCGRPVGVDNSMKFLKGEEAKYPAACPFCGPEEGSDANTEARSERDTE